MNQTEWIKKFEEQDCYWFHSGNPKKPHAELTSGKHSNGFFNSSKIIENPVICEQVCQALIDELDLEAPFPGKVFGVALGAIELSYEFGRQLSCLRGYTEPSIIDGIKFMMPKRFSIIEGDIFLPIEDVLTTGESIRNMIYTIEGMGGVITDKIAVILNRSGRSKFAGKKIVALINQFMEIWSPSDCPLCNQGSIALRPKANWKALLE